MDWSNEPWRKFYIRETDDDLLLGWEARAVWHEFLKKCDATGLIKTRRGALGLAAILKVPADVTARSLESLAADGRLQEVEAGFWAPNFVDAQAARTSTGQRKRDERTRGRAKSNGHNIDVTRSHSTSHDVTVSHSMSRSDQIRSERSDQRDQTRAYAREVFSPALIRRMIPEHPGVFMVLDADGFSVGLVRRLADGSEEIVQESEL